MEKALDQIVADAVAVLRGGGTILYPTDTVWGLGCDATDPEAVKKVFDIKKRDDSKSLVLLCSDLDMVARHVKEIPPMAIDLVEVNDAPMTIIYPGALTGRYHLAPQVVAEDGSVGIRIPSGGFCAALLKRFGKPLVSTSANVSGGPTPRNFSEIAPEIVSAVDFVTPSSLEKGATGKASQIIKVEMDGEVKLIRM